MEKGLPSMVMELHTKGNIFLHMGFGVWGLIGFGVSIGKGRTRRYVLLRSLDILFLDIWETIATYKSR
jgi:hypothetical protein